MTSQPPAPAAPAASAPRPRATGHRLPTGTLLTVAVLLIVPLLALLIVPLYSRETPRLWGFPFFYWWQFLWMFLETAMTYTAYLLVVRARRGAGPR